MESSSDAGASAFRKVVGVLMVVLIAFGALELMNVIHI